VGSDDRPALTFLTEARDAFLRPPIPPGLMRECCRQFMIDIYPMVKTPLLTILSLVFLMSCSTNSGQRELIDNTSLKYDTSKTTILSWKKASRFPFNQTDYDTAMLMQDDIGVIDSLLVSTVMNYNSSLTERYDSFRIDLGKNYRKQLIVVKNPKGEKIVWVNCFCRPWDKSWKTRALVVEDGGPCYFNFKVNLKTNTVYDFTVNGFA
jgi:hypothetical protein